MYLDNNRHKVVIAPYEIKEIGVYEETFLEFTYADRSYRTPLRITVIDKVPSNAPPIIVEDEDEIAVYTPPVKFTPNTVPFVYKDFRIKAASMNKIGKMTMEFTKPIRLPNIVIG